MTYRPLSTVLGSVADGAVVPSAYGDQCRDNQVALHEGWYFSATGAVSQSVAAATWTLAQMNAIDIVGVTASEVSLSSGYVLVTKTGRWLFSVFVAAATGGAIVAGAVSVGAATSFSVVAATTSGGTAYECSTEVRVSTAQYVSCWAFSSPGATLSSSLAPRVRGVWLGEL